MQQVAVRFSFAILFWGQPRKSSDLRRGACQIWSVADPANPALAVRFQDDLVSKLILRSNSSSTILTRK